VDESLAGRIRALMRADRVPGLSVAVVGGGQVRWSAGFGVADLASGAAEAPDTAHLWFSMTKVATASAVMRLVERGRVRSGPNARPAMG
jgi:CubicO group peptidase (beta-lactamase class C family)